MQYDSTTDAYEVSQPAQLTGSGEWRTHRFELSNAQFANSQSPAADFRIHQADGNLMIRSVRVTKESMLTVDADLGAANTANGLQLVEVSGDGQTTVTSVAGRTARVLTGSPTSLYMYMRVDDDYADQVEAGLNAIVEVVYFDTGSGSLGIQYDSTDTPYKAAQPVVIQNSGEWRTARFYLDDAFFGNSQNGAADFRLTGSNIPIDRVRRAAVVRRPGGARAGVGRRNRRPAAEQRHHRVVDDGRLEVGPDGPVDHPRR